MDFRLFSSSPNSLLFYLSTNFQFELFSLWYCQSFLSPLWISFLRQIFHYPRTIFIKVTSGPWFLLHSQNVPIKETSGGNWQPWASMPHGFGFWIWHLLFMLFIIIRLNSRLTNSTMRVKNNESQISSAYQIHILFVY